MNKPIVKKRQTTPIDFLKYKNLFIGLTLLLFLTSIFLLFFKGLNKSIDFTGGILLEIRFKEENDLKNLRSLISKNNIKDVSLQHIDRKTDVMIRMGNNNSDSKVKNYEQLMIKTLKNILIKEYPDMQIRKIDYVGPQIDSELIRSSILSVMIALIVIMIYIWFRFDWHFGLGGIIALFHDTIITIGFISLFWLDFSLSTVAAILTIIGYSINDSVVIFDRVRDNVRKYKKKPLIEILNLSITETLTRTLITAGTTLCAILALVIFGGPTLRSFSLTLFFGIIIGTYSSIYVATISLILMRFQSKRNELIKSS